MGFGDIANSGTMPISGGDAKSGNGGSSFGSGSRTKFGGLSYGNGVPPLLIGFIVLVLVGTAVYLKP